jgi:hypothetical protein
MTTPAIPEALKGTPKKKADVIFATEGGKTYAIPLSVASQYEFSDEHAALVTADKLAGEGDEVQGHHAVNLADGTFGYHADWLVGWYVWHVDGCTYHGLHRHPFGWTNPLAVDCDG